MQNVSIGKNNKTVAAVKRDMAHPVPPTNTDNFSTKRLSVKTSIKFEVYLHFSGLSFNAEVSFWRLLKTVVSCYLFIIIIIIIFIIINFL